MKRNLPADGIIPIPAAKRPKYASDNEVFIVVGIKNGEDRCLATIPSTMGPERVGERIDFHLAQGKERGYECLAVLKQSDLMP